MGWGWEKRNNGDGKSIQRSHPRLGDRENTFSSGEFKRAFLPQYPQGHGKLRKEVKSIIDVGIINHNFLREIFNHDEK